jgi:hypothetical protein
VKTIKINSREAIAFKVGFDAAEVDIAGDGNGGEIQFSYGYFADDRETLDEEAMRPEVSTGGPGPIVLQQTAAQVARARSAGAHLRVIAIIPDGMAIQDSRIESGTLLLKRSGGVDVTLNSGTVEADGNKGQTKMSVNSGTLRAAGLTPGFRHLITAKFGTIALQAGVLLPFVNAEVEQGVIQGAHEGRLERLGQSGWRLLPLHANTSTAVQCRVGAGTILLQAG